jgi:hypothetical protein
LKEPADHLALSGQPVRPGFAGRFPKASDCLVQRRESKTVSDCRLRSRSQQYFDALNVALKAGFVKGGIAIPVFGLYLRTLLQ